MVKENELPEIEKVLVNKLTQKANTILTALFAEEVFHPVVEINNQLNDIRNFVLGRGECGCDTNYLIGLYQRLNQAKFISQQQDTLKFFADYIREEDGE